MLANMYAAEMPSVLDWQTCMRENTLNYTKIKNYHDVLVSAIPFSETILSPYRFNINCMRQVAAQLLQCVVL